MTQTFIRIFALLSLLVSPVACATATASPGSTDPTAQEPPSSAERLARAKKAKKAKRAFKRHRIYTGVLGSLEEFEKYSVQVADERFSKAIIDVRTNDIYYFDTNVYQMHSEFVFKHIYKQEETPEKLAEFMANYDEEKPEFLLLYIINHQRVGMWTFAFWEGDRMQAKHIQNAYDRLQATFFAGKEIKFRPDSYDHRRVAKELKNVPTASNDELYSAQTYQLFNEGSRIGKLRIIDKLDPNGRYSLQFRPDEVILVNVPIPTLTVVSGIITEEFSTPLSHLGLRARAWGIPHIGLKNAAAAYREFDGSMVYFEARGDGHELRPATEAEVAEWKAEQSKARVVTLPPADLKERDIATLNELRASQGTAYGAKTANLGEIVNSKPKGYVVPPGFGIPIVYYKEHMERSGLDKKVTALLARSDELNRDLALRDRELTALRDAIRAAPIDPELMTSVLATAKKLNIWGGKKGLFVRSSTNAEDLPGFNGAGLYDTIANVRDEEALANAIRQVWASVWNAEAYAERDHFGVDHKGVYGAVLLQLGVNPTAAGVLVTVNMYDPTAEYTYTINAKKGLGIRVVDGHKRPEEILFDYKTNTIRVLARSDEDTRLVFDADGGVKEEAVPEGKGEPVLTDMRAARLVDAARRVAKVFPDNPQDIEWLIVDDEVYIVQSRPYVDPARNK